MKFVKFGAEDENPDEVITENEEIKTRKRKEPTACRNKNAKKKTPNKTASLNKLKRRAKDLDYNECKDDLNHLFYINTKAQRRVKHTLEPNLNVGLNVLEDFTDLPKHMYPHCAMSEVRPIYYAKKHCDVIDACFKRTIADGFYRIRLSAARTRYQNTWKKNRQIRKRAKNDIYPASLFTIAERLESKPDPYFYGNYDFFYTGGNLCTLPKQALTHNVMHVDHSESNALKLATYARVSNVDSTLLDECISTKLPIEGEIFQVSSFQSKKSAQNLIGVRQLMYYTLLSIDPLENTMKFLTNFKSEFEPLISAAQSLENPEKLVLTTMKQTLKVYDINNPKKTPKHQTIKVKNENCADFGTYWNCIKGWHGQTFLYANERQLFFADFRASQKQWLKTECTFSSKEYRCENNTSLVLSEFEHLFYVGTSHKLRCLDARFLTQPAHYEQATVCEWTHQLDYPPVYLDVHRDDAHEYVACASQVAGDLRICELTQSQHLEACDFESHCLPWQPPTLQEAYESACLAGKALQPEAGLKQRIHACTTGLSFFKIGNDQETTQALLMYANSNGDVYAQSLKRRQQNAVDERTNARSDAVMAGYAQNLSDLPQPALEYTDVADMKIMRSIFLSTQLNEKHIKQETDELNTEQQRREDDKMFRRCKGRWRKSMSTLKSYKDALVPDLLAIWDIPCDDETDINYKALKNKFKEEKSEKDILNWLNKNDKVAPTTTIPISNLNSLSTMDMEEFIGIEAQVQSAQITQNDTLDISVMSTSGLFDASVTPTSTRLVSAKPTKTAKVKKKHVKGF